MVVKQTNKCLRVLDPKAGKDNSIDMRNMCKIISNLILYKQKLVSKHVQLVY